MSNNQIWDETLIEKRVTYSIEVEERLVIVENVPARVNAETGERLFSPDTVERLQKIVHNQQRPKRFVETPVYEYA